jgi:phenylacetate-CoA ligase
MDVTLLMRVLSMRRVLRRHERWNANQIEAHQTAQLRTLRAHAYTHSRFYRKFHSGSETKPLHELPVLTKSELMSNFDIWLPTPMYTSPTFMLISSNSKVTTFSVGNIV